MDKHVTEKLNLTPRTHAELHSVLTSFELKWQNKARRQMLEGRISRF
ncbi:MAG TPA: hypothetical protein VLF40_03715 [Candidatus Saccharimonadales bacterium]|nr:hypothetical protein [Candidatus Saccharimonadales bacterium]